MNRLRMLIDNLWDVAIPSIETGGAVASLPLSNSQTYGRSKTSAITPDGAGNSVIEFDCPFLSLASGIVLYRHWLSDVAQWRVELFDELGQTGNMVYDSTLTDCTLTKTLGDLDWLVDPLVSSVFDGWPHKFSQLWFPGVFFQSGRITIIDEDARDGLHEFDRIYLGQAFSPTYNFSYGHSHQWLSTAEQRKTAAGSTFSAARQRYRQIEFSLDFLNAQERPVLSEAFRQVGLSKDFFISMFPEQGGKEEIEYAMSCKFLDNPAITGQFFNNYSTPIKVQEA